MGVTDASVETTTQYRATHGLDFPILAQAKNTRKAWGVKVIWGNVIRLVDPTDVVVAEGLTGAASKLAGRL